MSFVTDADVKAYVKDLVVKATTEDLAAYWDSIISVSNAAAYRFIVTYWASKGYIGSQIAQWDFREDFQKQLAGFFSCSRVYELYPADYGGQLQAFRDPRKDLLGDTQLGLEPQPLIIGGEFADPEGARGGVSFGPYSTEDDLFLLGADDSRLGQTTSL